MEKIKTRQGDMVEQQEIASQMNEAIKTRAIRELKEMGYGPWKMQWSDFYQYYCELHERIMKKSFIVIPPKQ